MTLGPARERVRVARALRGLPRISAEMESGQLSWCKARAITRVATPESDGEWVELARLSTGSQLEQMTRLYRRERADVFGHESHASGDQADVAGVTTDEAGHRSDATAHKTDMFGPKTKPSPPKEAWLRHHFDDGLMVIQVRVEPEDGERVLAALRAARDTLRDEGEQNVSAGASGTPSPPTMLDEQRALNAPAQPPPTAPRSQPAPPPPPPCGSRRATSARSRPDPPETPPAAP